MRSTLLVIGALCAGAPFVTSCARDVSRVETAHLQRRNPTAYVFRGSPDEVHERVREGLRGGEAPDEVFGKDRSGSARDDTQYADYFSVEDAHDSTFGSDILSQPGNEQDIYVHTFGAPLWASPVYRGSHGTLPYVAAFHLHIAGVGDGRTLVDVRAVEPRVRNGMVWGIGPCGPGYGWHYERVEPTTVEEYALLRYVGRILGETGMPPMVLPAPSE